MDDGAIDGRSIILVDHGTPVGEVNQGAMLSLLSWANFLGNQLSLLVWNVEVELSIF